MRKFILFLYLSIFTFFIGIGCYAENAFSTAQNTKIELIYSYIINLKEKIILFQKKYNIEGDVILKKEVHNLSLIISTLNQIKNKNMNEDKKTQIITIMLKKLKKSKNKITQILREKKEGAEKIMISKQIVFGKLGKKVSLQLDNIIIQIYKIIKKDGVTQREEKILKSLKALYRISQDLQLFAKLDFKSVADIKAKFITKLRGIKKELIFIKKIGLHNN